MKNILKGRGMSGSRSALLIVVSLALSLFLCAFRVFSEAFMRVYIYCDDAYSSMYQAFFDSIHILPLVLLFAFSFAIIFALMLAFDNNYKKCLSYIYKYRYLIGLAILLVCVIFKLSGSSVALWIRYTGDTNAESGVLFGYPKPIRGDDVCTWTPIAASQMPENGGLLGRISYIVRGTATDVTMEYGAPAWALVTLFRPLYWGYLFLGFDRGLSFMWTARLLAFFFVSFELAMVYTNGNKRLSACAGFLVMWAPVIQWWFNTAQQVEVILWAEAAVLLFHLLITTDGKRILLKKLLSAFGLFISCGAFVFVLYPAWQVPTAYIALALALYIFLRDRKHNSWVWKRDGFIFAGTLVILTAFIALILYTSRDTLSSIMNTVYPGSRQATGGGGIHNLTYYPATILTTIYPDAAKVNTCEFSQFYSFAPLGLLLSAFVMIKKKKPDIMLVPLIVVQAFLLTYTLVGFPEILAKLTLMGYSPTWRTMMMAVSFTDLLLLFRSLALYAEDGYSPKTAKALVITAGMAAAITMMCVYCGEGHVTLWMTVPIFAVLAVGIFLILSINKKGALNLFVIYCVAVAFLTGGIVNPIQHGTVVGELELTKTISDIREEDPDALWISEIDYPMTDITLFCGAGTINSINIYPALDRWEKLDPDSEYSDVYNRYAHISIDITKDETSFELTGDDTFDLMLNYSDLATLDVDYILTKADHDERPVHGITLDKIAETGDYRIYKVKKEGGAE